MTAEKNSSIFNNNIEEHIGDIKLNVLKSIEINKKNSNSNVNDS